MTGVLCLTYLANMEHIENIVIGKPLVEAANFFAYDTNDWETIEKERTFFTEERFLPKILVELGFYPSISEIRRNKPELCISLNEVNFIPNLKVRKKMFVSILIGE